MAPTGVESAGVGRLRLVSPLTTRASLLRHPGLAVVGTILALGAAIAVHHFEPVDASAEHGAIVCLAVLGFAAAGAAVAVAVASGRGVLLLPWLLPSPAATGPRWSPRQTSRGSPLRPCVRQE